MCAAAKLPAELQEAMAAYPAEIPNRAEIDVAIADTLKKGTGKPAGFPFIDKAPTGRAKCMQCHEPIAKDSFRIAVEREIDTGTMVTRGAGYMHPKCAIPHLETTGASLDELIEGLRANSRLAPEDLEAAIAELEAGAAPA